MTEKAKRQPSATTLRTRAFGRVALLRQKIENRERVASSLQERYEVAIKALRAELAEAQAEFDALGKTAEDN